MKAKKEKKVIGKIITWGYQSRRIEELLTICAEENVKIVVDIRRSPQSKQPYWNKYALEQYLTGQDGIPQYFHLAGLGNYNFQGRGWVSAKPSLLNSALEQIDQAISMGLYVLLLCREQEYIACHRQEVSSLIRERTGCDVVHLGGKHGPAKKGEQMSMLAMMGLK